MKVYRIANKKYANLEGVGGLFSWGRWHEKGFRVIYTAESRALAAWEKLVHISDINLLPNNLVMIEIDIPREKIKTVPDVVLAPNWNRYPYIKETVQYGSDFLSDTNNLILKVPSVVIHGEFNYIINPAGKEIDKCSTVNITSFEFDNRVIKP